METRDYSKFKFMDSNRETNPKKVADLKISLTNFGYIPGRPVLIDGVGNIVDGQHRFLAMKKLGLPIPFEVVTGDIVAKTMILNSTQKSWAIYDYIRSYSNQGIDCYRQLLKFHEKYKFSVSVTLIIATMEEVKAKSLREGKHFELKADANEIAEYVLSLSAVDFYQRKEFVRAIVSAHKRLSNKQMEFIKSNILSVPKCATTSDFLVVFENLLNHRKRGENRIKL